MSNQYGAQIKIKFGMQVYPNKESIFSRIKSLTVFFLSERFYKYIAELFIHISLPKQKLIYFESATPNSTEKELLYKLVDLFSKK